MSFLIILISILSHLSEPISKGSKMYSNAILKAKIKEYEYKKKYNQTIEYIKLCEGYRKTAYNDGNFKAIGYGQRILCYPGKINDSLTEIQADSLLRLSFENHLKLSRRCFPKLPKYKILAIGHMSYCIGIGRIKKLNIISNGVLNEYNLLKIRNKDRRKYEIKLFNYGKTKI